jgi:hypothetical protein
MSRTTDYLLHRDGRNQFGIENDDLPSAKNVHNRQRLKEEFLDQYGKRWLNLFTGLNKKQIWSLIYANENKGFRKISLTSFYSETRNWPIDSYLEKFLLLNKDFSLSVIGISDEERNSVIKEFNANYWGSA